MKKLLLIGIIIGISGLTFFSKDYFLERFEPLPTGSRQWFKGK